MSSPEESSTGPVIRDLRRIDPTAGQVRTPGQEGAAQPAAGPRGPGKPSRPGKHAASKPGRSAGKGLPGDSGRGGGAPSGGTPGTPGAQGTPGTRPAAGTQPAPGPGAVPSEASGASRAATPGPQATSPGPGATPSAAPRYGKDIAGRLAERTADLQRVTAEYANYRKRVERDRLVVREQALANVLNALLPVLDDIGRAREHGELTGGFKSVAESLDAITGKLGLISFGAEGEPFDPRIHEALVHSYSADVTEPACVKILQPGYKVGERILRPARVAVAEPAEPSGAGALAGAADPGMRGGTPGAGEPGGPSQGAAPAAPGGAGGAGGNIAGGVGSGAGQQSDSNEADSNSGGPAAPAGSAHGTPGQPGTHADGD